MKPATMRLALAVLLGASSIGYLACESDSGAVKEQNPPKDAGGGNGDGGPNGGDGGGSSGDGGPSDCFQNPQTHDEIINACTDAVKIAKNPTLPLQYPDGGLPPLP